MHYQKHKIQKNPQILLKQRTTQFRKHRHPERTNRWMTQQRTKGNSDNILTHGIKSEQVTGGNTDDINRG